MKLAIWIILALMAGLPVAEAQQPPIPLVRGPWDPARTQATINQLTTQINAILVPLLPDVTSAVNFVSLTPAITGENAVIGLSSGSDANAGITINPNGSGDIVLFGSGDTGVLQIANVTSFVPAKGLAGCPSVKAGAYQPFGVHDTIQGFFVIADWAGRNRYLPSC